jgi:hypothetical protein
VVDLEVVGEKAEDLEVVLVVVEVEELEGVLVEAMEEV